MSKIADFTLSHMYLAPPLKVTPLQFRRDLWRNKSRFPGLLYSSVRDPTFQPF